MFHLAHVFIQAFIVKCFHCVTQTKQWTASDILRWFRSAGFNEQKLNQSILKRDMKGEELLRIKNRTQIEWISKTKDRAYNERLLQLIQERQRQYKAWENARSVNQLQVPRSQYRGDERPNSGQFSYSNHRNHARQHSNNVRFHPYSSYQRPRNTYNRFVHHNKSTKNKGKRWNKEELEYAYELNMVDHQDFPQIAEELERTPISVLNKVNFIKRYFDENYGHIPINPGEINLVHIVRTQNKRERRHKQAMRRQIYGTNYASSDQDSDEI